VIYFPQMFYEPQQEV